MTSMLACSLVGGVILSIVCDVIRGNVKHTHDFGRYDTVRLFKDLPTFHSVKVP